MLTRPKFIQILTSTSPEGDVILALDEDGDVWQYVLPEESPVPYWSPLSSERRREE